MKYFLFIFLLIVPRALSAQGVILEPGWTTFYLHAPNSFKLHVGKLRCENVVVKAKYGTIKRNSQDCEFYYWNNHCDLDRDVLTVFNVAKNDTLPIDTIIVKLNEEALKSIPIGFSGKCFSSLKRKCPINKNEIVISRLDTALYYPDLFARLLNWDVELYYKIRKYSIDQNRDGKLINSEQNIPGNALTDKWVQIMQAANKNDEFRFYNVYLIFDDCEKSFEGPTIYIE